MSKLPRNVKPQKLIKFLNKLGFLESKGKGSHVRLIHPDGRWTQVSVHPGPIPGTVGGAVYGNAGAYGQTISDHLVNITGLKDGELVTLTKDQCLFSYRDSDFKRTGLTILEISFSLSKGNQEALKAESEETLRIRLAKYHPGIKCPGSFFKNIIASDLDTSQLQSIPEEKIVYGKVPAGYLLEEVGAKNQRQGQIIIAPYHANLFINEGGGTAKDFYQLAKTFKESVREKFGISLEPEVQLINLPPLS